MQLNYGPTEYVLVQMGKKSVIIISRKCFKGFIYSTGFSNWRKLRYDSIKEDQL